MSIYENIKKDMVFSIKLKNNELKSLLRVLVSDIQRDPKKDYSDDKVRIVIKKTVKMLYDNYDKFNKDQDLIDAEYLDRVYLPKKISDKEIEDFLNTIDFSKLKNKMQAIGIVTRNFPDGSIDGNVVKQIILGR